MFNFCLHLIYLLFSTLYKALCFITLLINVLLGCVERELKPQQDVLKDKSITIALLNKLYLNYDDIYEVFTVNH